MKVTIQRLSLKDNPDNEVISSKLFKKKKIIDDNGNFRFHEQGIFSKKIFGQFSKCDCGKLTTVGYCPDCECRVIDKTEMPDYYIKLPCRVVNLFESINNPDILNLLKYNGFLYEGVYQELEILNLGNIEPNKILYGKEACLYLGLSEEEYDNITSNKLYIPHPMFRKLIKGKDQKYILGDVNKALLEVIKKKEYLEKYTTLDSLSKLIICKELNSQLEEFYSSIFTSISIGKNSIINREVKGQDLTGAIRAVLTNNFNLDENKVIIGNYYIEYLYPELYRQYSDGNSIDIEGINKELRSRNYKVLVNRQPTISEKSIMAFYPEFSLTERYTMQMNPISFDGFGADTDGDVLCIIALYTDEANLEAERLLSVNNYIGNASGTIRNKIFEDLEYIMKKVYLEESEISNIIHDMIED